MKHMEDKLDKILANQSLIISLLLKIQKEMGKSKMGEDYAANLLAQATEIAFFQKQR